MRPSQPKHFKGCVFYTNARRREPNGGLEKYNAWCSKKGDTASKSVGWCKNNDMKRTTTVPLVRSDTGE
jgi:hypothetical protein